MPKLNTLNQAQIVFTIDPRLKKKALDKVRQEGATLKNLLTMAVKAYVNDNLMLGLYPKTEEPTQYLLDAVSEAREDLKYGRVSPDFDNAKDAIKWLNSKNKKYAS